jgi:hypothetical protein
MKRKVRTMKRDAIKTFRLTNDELKKIRGTHGFGSWKMACAGCGRQFTEANIGEMIVSVPRKKPHHAPKFYYHLKCFNQRNRDRSPPLLTWNLIRRTKD